MKWWKLALIMTLIWTVGTIGAGFVHIEVISPQVLETNQVAALWQFYWLGMGVGTIGTWIACFAMKKAIETT